MYTPLHPPIQASDPIVVLDSGLGGLTVARALREVLPLEDIVYFGDTARLPYGSKSAETITKFVHQIITYLRPINPKHVVIACNTATALSLRAIRAAFPGLSISGVIEPGSKAAVVAAGSKQVPVIGILATEATVRSRLAYSHAIHRKRHYARVIQQAAPLLVPIIEEGRKLDDPVTKLALKQYLQPMVNHRMSVCVLGCTHYPVLRPIIENLLGEEIPVIDSARLCAEDVTRRLTSKNLLRGAASLMTDPMSVVGAFRCLVTDDPERFAKLAPRFLGCDIDRPTWVSPDDLYELTPEIPSVRQAI